MKNLKIILLGLAIVAAGCTKPVEDPVLSVSGVVVEFSTLTLKVGEHKTIRALVSPGNADDTTVSWKSNNENVATVDAVTGEVVAVAEGTATITVTTTDGGKTDMCTVTVLPTIYEFVREGVEPSADGTTTISWGLTENGLLVIGGNGAMRDYVLSGNDDATAHTDAPWFDLNVTSLIIGDGVTAVGKYSFALMQSVTNVFVGNSVRAIGNGAFARSYNLAAATLSEGVKTIGTSAFYLCSALKNIAFPNSVTHVGDNAFYGCTAMKSVTFGESLVSVGEYSFTGCTLLESISLPDKTHTIGMAAFSYCSVLKNVSFGSGMQDIMDLAFANCPLLDDVVLPEGLLGIYPRSFAVCKSLTSIVIPDSATFVGESAFDDCDALENVVIGSGVQSIEKWAFGRCDALTDVTIKATTPPTMLNDSEAEYYNFFIEGDVLHVPTGCKTAYEEDEEWSRVFTTIVEEE